jgi:hypothetical protein
MVETIAKGESYKVTAGSQSSNLLRDPATVIIPELVVSMYFSPVFTELSLIFYSIF